MLEKPQDVLKYAQERGAQFVDLRFCDLPGLKQHFTMPISELSESMFEEGAGFDGSSIRGFQTIDVSDMVLIPDASSAYMDPFTQYPTINLLCNVFDPITKQAYSRDPRFVAQKAEKYLMESGIGDVSYWGPEAEFFIFDNVRFDQNSHEGYYHVDSEEGIWNSGRDWELDGVPNLGYKPRSKQGYFPVPPMDSQNDLRSEMVAEMVALGMDIECQHHEVATAGQAEIDMGYSTLVKMADQLLLYKYIIKNVALRNGKTVTFMPKPLFMDNGSGMHVHVSIWKNGQNQMYDEKGYAGLSQMAKHFIGGVLKHAPAVLAFAAPTTNSYRRLVPGYEAPVNLAYSARNRSAAVRIPMYSASPKAKRVEFRCPDPSCNPYFAFPAILMAGLDGVKNEIDPGSPLDKDIYELPPEEAAQIPSTPGSLDASLRALEEDHDFLLEGGVFTQDVVETWVSYKRENEVDAINLRPHPWEFFLYYDI
jgi:glutamine synthetase